MYHRFTGTFQRGFAHSSATLVIFSIFAESRQLESQLRTDAPRERVTHGRTMTIFELVKVALDQLYAEGTERHHSKLDDIVIKNIRNLSASYAQLANPKRTPVDYEDPATRLAYVYKYVGAHSDYVVQLLEKLARRHRAFDATDVRLSCIGGGPGSDIIGVLKYLEEHRDEKPVKKLICHLLDHEQAWSDTWTEIDKFLISHTSVQVYFQRFDIANTESWKHQKKFLQADIFTMIYFVSEVLALDKGGVVAESWRRIFEGAKSGAVFLYVDNGSADFTSFFDKHCIAAKLKCLQSGDNERWVLRFSEQASVLEEYRKKFGENPKIQSRLSYRVLRKP